MKRVSACLGLLVLFLFFADGAFAHGGGTLQIVNAPIAAYQVSVWSAPTTVRAQDDIHITVGVGALANGAPVLDTAVQVDVYELESGTLIASEAATTEQSINRLFYEADIAGLPQGDYQFVVTVAGDAGIGSVAFDLNIRPYLNMPLFLGAALIVFLFLTGGLLVFKRSQPQAETRSRRTKHLARN